MSSEWISIPKINLIKAGSNDEAAAPPDAANVRLGRSGPAGVPGPPRPAALCFGTFPGVTGCRGLGDRRASQRQQQQQQLHTAVSCARVTPPPQCREPVSTRRDLTYSHDGRQLTTPLHASVAWPPLRTPRRVRGTRLPASSVLLLICPGPEPLTASSSDNLPDLMTHLGARGLRAPKPRFPFPSAPPRDALSPPGGKVRAGARPGRDNGSVGSVTEIWGWILRISLALGGYLEANVQSPQGSVRSHFFFCLIHIAELTEEPSSWLSTLASVSTNSITARSTGGQTTSQTKFYE